MIDNIHGRKGRPSRKERLFWEKFPELLMDYPDEEINPDECCVNCIVWKQ